MIYKFKDEARIPKRLNHERMCSELQRIGRLTPPTVLKAARRRTSSLHDYFDWDDSVAGEKWRLEQAGHLIRSVVQVDDTKTDAPEVRLYWPVTVTTVADDGEEEKEGFFVTAEEAAKNSAYRMQIRWRGLQELRALRRKYSDFEDFARVWAAVDELEEAG